MNGQIIFIIGDRPNEPNGIYCHLGHELHGARSLIFDLLCKNVITNEQTTILTMKDRMFLYNHLFNTLSHEDDVIELSNYEHIINLNKFVQDPRAALYSKEYFHKLTNDKFKDLYEPIGFNNYKYKPFITSVTTCNVNKIDPFDSDFIIIHYRNYRNVPNVWNNSTDRTVDSLNNLLKIIDETKLSKNVVIFGNVDGKINNIGLNITMTKNLKELVSYMKSDYCKVLISTWSGAGQLGQYFFNNKILFYFIGDQVDLINNYPIQIQRYSCDSYSWDWQKHSSCMRYFLRDESHLYTFLNKDTMKHSMSNIANDLEFET